MTLNGVHPAHWDLSFLTEDKNNTAPSTPRALIILNQPFTRRLLATCWRISEWRCCADGGANRLHDTLARGERDGSTGVDVRNDYLPDLIKGDFDSLRDDTRAFYEGLGVPVIHDHDQYSTDLMKCVESVREWEASLQSGQRAEILILGGLSGRIDQTIHTLSYVHKLRNDNRRVYVITDENIGWVLKEGEHIIHIDRDILGPTCGLLPVGIDSTMLTTKGLKWDLTNHPSSFDGMVSTSNAVVSDEVRISTTKPIWWCVELAEGFVKA